MRKEEIEYAYVDSKEAYERVLECKEALGLAKNDKFENGEFWDVEVSENDSVFS